jgi:hypothetical protein
MISNMNAGGLSTCLRVMLTSAADEKVPIHLRLPAPQAFMQHHVMHAQMQMGWPLHTC